MDCMRSSIWEEKDWAWTGHVWPIVVFVLYVFASLFALQKDK